MKENIKAPRHWPFVGNSPVTGEFPAQMASNAENFSLWWRHHDVKSNYFMRRNFKRIKYISEGYTKSVIDYEVDTW